MFESTIRFIRELYPEKTQIALHEPVFRGNEKKYVTDCIDSTFVSSVGEYVNRFEREVAAYTGVKYGVATMNGTAALHIALLLSGVDESTEVLTQALTFVATANAIAYSRATPVFIDSEAESFGMCPLALMNYLEHAAERRSDGSYNRRTGKRIAACVPMHVFGHPVQIQKIASICADYKIDLIEDAAESLGSHVGSVHTGNFGRTATLSFNGNKTITTGGGGMIITNDEVLAKRAKHLTTTAKRPHAFEFYHDEVGYNYRMPNLNAALGCAQLEELNSFLANKRETALRYKEFFARTEIRFLEEPRGTTSNYWLCAILLKDRAERDLFLEETNKNGVMTRPLWQLMPDLPAFATAPRTEIPVARDLIDRVVNLPSGVRGG